MHAFLRNFASVLFRPSATIQSILGRRDPAVLPLVSAALMSLFLREFSKPSFSLAVQQSPASVLVTVMCVLCLVFVVSLLLFFLFSALALFVARKIFEGEGTLRDVQSALAWSLVPQIWALLYRIPLAFQGGSNAFPLAAGVDFLIGIWTLSLAAFTLAEALKYSPLSALGTVVLSTIGPVIMIAGAALVVG